MTAYIPFTYYLYHKPTGKKYYGARYKKGTTPEDLWTIYFTSCKRVHDLIKMYGADSFVVEIRKTFKTKEETRLWEQKVLKRLKVAKNKNWLNVSYGTGIENNVTYGMLGKKHTKETRELMSKKQSGENNPMFGKTHSIEVRNIISKSGKGRKHSEETKQRLRDITKGRRPAESTLIASQTLEANSKRSKSLRGHPVSDETKEKIRLANTGRKQSEETKRKRVETRIRNRLLKEKL